ncbi:MAG: hypothetical protein PHN16_05935 [Candidatus Omnitrophica bacterium]|nr:hypothetical protein [Candidatus Omnitrophota bacterium]
MIKSNLKVIFIAGCFLISAFSLTAAAETTEASDKAAKLDKAGISVNTGDPGKMKAPVKAEEQIVLSGKVVFDAYRSGEITVAVNEGGTSYEGKKFKLLNSTVLDTPGFFFVSVPPHSGKIFLEAYIAENTPEGLKYMAWGKYSSNPLMVDAGNIEDLDIVMSGTLIDNKMNNYRGKAVAIKGRVTFDNYKNGPIYINASSSQGKVPDINSISIDAPGEYVLNVPVDSGAVYITAVNGDLESRQSQKAIGSYGNPVEVGSSDVEGVDIKLYEDVSSSIGKLSTVTIRGRISVANFNGEIIHVGVGKVNYERPNINFTDLSAPGEYVLKVPKNSGPVYVTSGAGERFKSYKNNPVLVKDADIAGIDIEL